MKFEPKEYELMRQYRNQFNTMRQQTDFSSGGSTPAGRRIRSQAKCEQTTPAIDWSKYKPK